MMRKAVLIIGLVTVMVLLLAGCGQQAADTDIQSVERSGSKVELPYAEELEEDAPAGEPVEEPGDETSADPDTPPTDPEQEREIPVSESELDHLKAEIEGMEFEDLGGLSEE